MKRADIATLTIEAVEGETIRYGMTYHYGNNVTSFTHETLAIGETQQLYPARNDEQVVNARIGELEKITIKLISIEGDGRAVYKLIKEMGGGWSEIPGPTSVGDVMQVYPEELPPLEEWPQQNI